jgi:sialate O-acetylesterase
MLPVGCRTQNKFFNLMLKYQITCMNKWMLFLFIGLTGLSVRAQVRLPKLFGDSMVLQRDQPIPVWGWAGKNESITIRFRNQKKTVRAGSDGRWKIALNPEPAGGPYALQVKGKNTIVLNNVLVGDVWICSGQSNMEWPVSASNNAASEIESANYPLIRHIKVVNDVGERPKEDLQHKAAWQAATPEHAGSFTAVGYFFARHLHQQLGVPIGLINSTWGGTDVETWTSREAFENNAEFKNMIAAIPVINMDSMAKARNQAVLASIQQLQGSLPDAATVQNWPATDLNDTAWASMALPQLWESGPLPDIDGTVWFRKIIQLTKEQADQQAVLHLAMIDDNDEAYVNGEKIGTTNGYNVKRVYRVPAGVLKEGRNVIAVRVDDTGGGGGVYGDAGDLKLQTGSNGIKLDGDWKFRVESIQEGGGFANPNSFPTLLYNAMVHPLIPFAMKGVLWYQGENNAGRAHQYRTAFPLMVQDWRTRWGSDFPFYFVQLASFEGGGGDSRKGSTWAELREAQTATLSLPNTGMAVTTDIGEATDIHPKNKQDVGLRLAAIALNKVYGKGNVYSGPVFQSMKTEGNKMVLSFTSTGSGLMARDKYGYLRGFEVAGQDQVFYYAKAFVEGDKVVVYADDVAAPVAVRYAWANDAGDANLYNKEGFPAVPFRTDTWKGITETARYRNAAP